MSFIGSPSKGKTYAPGFFLAHEECERKTREIPQSMATTEGNGTKYVKMGSAYPSNDGNAVGLVYEDVDVTTGNMPGSVVLKGVVYENRLPITSVSYDAVTPKSGDNPTEEGWYERSGSSPNYVYTLTTDTTVDSEKTYYAKTVTRLASAAKSALEARGFTFKTEPTVTRPY